MGPGVEILRSHIISILDLIHFRDFATLNQYLEEVDLTGMDPTVMIAIIRSSSIARQVLPAWQPLLDRMRQHCLDTEVPDAHKLFRGLPYGKGD